MRALPSLALYAAVGLVTAGTIGVVAVAEAHARGPAGFAAAADDPATDASGSIVETFEYPNADQVLATRHVKLTSGDGHILLVDCSTPPVNNVGAIEVHTGAAGVGTLCFKVHGDTGLLNLEVPSVFEIRGDGRAAGAGHDITATVDTADSDPRQIPINPDSSTPIGIGDPHDNRDTTLLQLKVTS
jgi:hypothetical protein